MSKYGKSGAGGVWRARAEHTSINLIYLPNKSDGRNAIGRERMKARGIFPFTFNFLFWGNKLIRTVVRFRIHILSGARSAARGRYVRRTNTHVDSNDVPCRVCRTNRDARNRYVNWNVDSRALQSVKFRECGLWAFAVCVYVRM